MSDFILFSEDSAYPSLYFFLCQAPWASASAPCKRKGWEWWHFLPTAVRAGAKERPGLQLHRGAAWGKHPGTQLCFCASARPCSGVVYTALSYQGLSPDKSIQQWSWNSITYLVHSSLSCNGCMCGSKHSNNQTGSKGINNEVVLTTILWTWQWRGLMR